MTTEKGKKQDAVPASTVKTASSAPKTKKQRGVVRRALKRAEPKINENPKSAMFIRSTTANQRTLNVMKDLVRSYFISFICRRLV